MLRKMIRYQATAVKVFIARLKTSGNFQSDLTRNTAYK